MGGKADKGIGNVRGACADELQVVSHKSTKWKRFCQSKKKFDALLSQGLAGLPSAMFYDPGNHTLMLMATLPLKSRAG